MARFRKVSASFRPIYQLLQKLQLFKIKKKTSLTLIELGRGGGGERQIPPLSGFLMLHLNG